MANLDIDNLPKNLTEVGVRVLDDGLHRAYAITADKKTFICDTDMFTARSIAKQLGKLIVGGK